MASDDLDKDLTNRYGGAHAPVKTGHAVYYEPGTVGAGRPFRPGRSFEEIARQSAPAYLRDLSTNNSAFMPLWPYELELDFALSGVTGQSRTKRDFYPRHLTTPKIIVRCQTFNPYLYNKTTRFVRRHQLHQVMAGGTKVHQHKGDMMQLVVKGTSGPNRTTKGGYRGMTLLGFVENVPAGAERFVQAPEVEFQFVLHDAESGIFSHLDRLAHLHEGVVNYMSAFGKYLKDPNIDPPKSFGSPKPKPETPVPPPDNDEVNLEPNPNQSIADAGRAIWDMLIGDDG